MDSCSDAELVGRVRLGDSEAFNQLMDRHIDAAYAIALAHARNAADAEDICQDAFLIALERVEQCSSPDRFRAWLFQIVRNRTHNLHRYHAVRAQVGIDAGSDVPSESNPGRDIERAELRDRIVTALQQLSDIQRQVVVLFDMEDWNHRDIARTLGISEGASRAALFKARSALRTLLDPLSHRQNDEQG